MVMAAIKPMALQEFEKIERPKFCWDCEAFNKDDETCAEYGKVPVEAQNTPNQCEKWLWIPF